MGGGGQGGWGGEEGGKAKREFAWPFRYDVGTAGHDRLGEMGGGGMGGGVATAEVDPEKAVGGKGEEEEWR